MSRRACLVLLLVVCALPCFAQNWVEVKSPNFSVVTDAGEKRGREIALRFEQMRKVFQTLIPKDKLNVTAPLQIIAFRNDSGLKQVAPLYKGKPVEIAGVYYQGDDRNYIAVNSSAEDGWHVVFHEYAHLLLNTNLPPTPLWFDEGFAEYYSTIKVDKKQFHIGEAPPNYGFLFESRLMPLEELFSKVHESEDYNKSGERRSLLYAESWLFVHFIYDTNRVQQVIQYFNNTRNEHMPVAEALQKAFGMPAKDLDKALAKYLGGNSIKVTSYLVPPGIEDVTYTSTKLKDYEAQSYVADLHLHARDYGDKAISEYQQILQKQPGFAAAHRGLGYAYWRAGDQGKAGEEFRKAVALDSNDPRVYYFAALLESKKIGSTRDQEILVEMNQMLDKALALDSNYAEAYDLKGYALSSAGNYSEAISLLKKAVQLAPRKEHFQLNLSSQYIAAKKYDEAIALLERLKGSTDPNIAMAAEVNLKNAQDWKANPILQLASESPDKYTAPQWRPKKGTAQEKELEELAQKQNGGGDDVKADLRPVKFVRAVLQAVECSAQGPVTMSVLVGVKKLSLKAASPEKVLVIGDEKFECGWKNKRVSLNYKESSPTTGDVVSIEVR